MANLVSTLVLAWLNITFFWYMLQVRSLSIQLIHRDSPQSPLYNQSISQSELLTNEVQRSHARVSRLNSISNNINEKTVSSIILRGYRSTYLTLYYVGSTYFMIYAYVSLMTNIVWIKCALENNTNEILFEENRTSISYERILGGDPACNMFTGVEVEPSLSKFCSYISVDETKGIYSKGLVGKDVIDWSSQGGFTQYSQDDLKIYFGCSFENSDFGNDDVRGVVGLGRGRMSLPSQLHQTKKFSYCLLSAANRRRDDNGTLKFGSIDENLKETMSSSPLYSQVHPYYSGAYFLQFEGISIGIGIDNNDKIGTYESRHLIAIDCGIAMTYLRYSIYEEVEKRVKTIMGESALPLDGFNLCFDDNSSDRTLLPKMVFHFANGANFILEPGNVFVEIKRDDESTISCLAIFPVTGTHNAISIFGSQAQEGHIIHFDLPEEEDHKLYFTAPMDCYSF